MGLECWAKAAPNCLRCQSPVHSLGIAPAVLLQLAAHALSISFSTCLLSGFEGDFPESLRCGPVRVRVLEQL